MKLIFSGMSKIATFYFLMARQIIQTLNDFCVLSELFPSLFTHNCILKCGHYILRKKRNEQVHLTLLLCLGGITFLLSLASLALVSWIQDCPQPSAPSPSQRLQRTQLPQCFEFNFSVLNFCILWVLNIATAAKY